MHGTTWSDIQRMEDGTYTRTPEEERAHAEGIERQLEVEEDMYGDGPRPWEDYDFD